MTINNISNPPAECTGADFPCPKSRKPLQVLRGGNQSEKPAVKPHCKVSTEDINWVRQQPPCVQQLYFDCIAAEQFGGAFHKLETNLTYKSFQKASAALTAAGLFEFEELFGRLPSGRPGLIGHRVRNLHGYYNRSYWENNSIDQIAVHTEQKTNLAVAEQNHPQVEQIHPPTETFQKNGQKSEEFQGFQNPNNVANYYLTTTQLPTKVVGVGDELDALFVVLGSDQAADAPLRGTSPSGDESADEEKEKVTVGLAEGNESQMVASCSTSLDSSDNSQLLDRDNSSAPAPLLSEKWTSEAITLRMQLRPGRMDQLKRAGMFGDNPGFDYLQECWDDPALRIMVKRLITKFPQWRIACVDEELVNWNEE